MLCPSSSSLHFCPPLLPSTSDGIPLAGYKFPVFAHLASSLFSPSQCCYDELGVIAIFSNLLPLTWVAGNPLAELQIYPSRSCGDLYQICYFTAVVLCLHRPLASLEYTVKVRASPVPPSLLPCSSCARCLPHQQSSVQPLPLLRMPSTNSQDLDLSHHSSSKAKTTPFPIVPCSKTSLES